MMLIAFDFFCMSNDCNIFGEKKMLNNSLNKLLYFDDAFMRILEL